MSLVLEDSAVEYLATRGYDPIFGARPVKRVVQKELETALAKALLRGEFGEEDEVIVSAPGGSTARGLELRKGSGAGTPGSDGAKHAADVLG